MISLDLSRVAENSTLISVLMTCSSAWMESALLDPAGGQRWVIYDEAWRLMSHPALLKRMMDWLVCEEVPAEYVPMMVEEMELDGRDSRADAPSPAAADLPVVVIGCG